MTVKIVRDGKELGIREIVDYLERHYGIPSADMRSVSVVGEVGEPVLVTVSVYMQNEPADLPGPVGEEAAPEGDRK